MRKANGSGNGKLTEGPRSALLTERRRRTVKDPARRDGVVAEEAQLRARIELARALGDPAEERAAARRLAEMLAARGVEIDVAVELAFRALATRDDPPLRHALAGWLEGLGEPGLASSELRKLAAASTGAAAAAVLVRIGVLHARAGDPVGAQEALTEAAELDEADALPLELLGAVAAWATAAHGGVDLDVDGFPGPRAGAEAYVRAARRRAAARDGEGELDNLLRAFELDPSSPLAAAALMSAYMVREREEAADEVLRAHAAALGDGARASGPRSSRGDQATADEVHARRRRTALEAGHVGRALGAGLDERLDAVFAGPGADAFDDLLARASAYEPLAIRLELRAEREHGRAAAARWLELGRLLAGPLAAAERATPALARAAAADASNAEAVHALRAHALRTGDPAWFVEALVRAALGAAAHGALEDVGARLAAAHELASFAEENGDPLLAAWAYRVTRELDPADERARAGAARLESTLIRREEELAAALAALEAGSVEDRPSHLLEVARLARSVPGASRALAAALVELAALRIDAGAPSHEDEGAFGEALRVAERVGDFEGMARIARARLAARGPNVAVRGALVSALRRMGDLAGAAEEARAFAEESATRWTCSVAWITAAAADDEATRARALAAAALTCGARVVGAMSAVAAEALADAGELDAARRAAEQACRADGQSARALLVLARLASDGEPRVARAAALRAMDVARPTAASCARLAGVLERGGDPRGAIAWARRVVSLRPGDPAATQELVERAVRAGDGDALADVLAWLAPQPRSSKELAEQLAPGLEALGALDPPRAAALCRRALDVLGPRHAPLRRAIAGVAAVAGDARLRATLDERWIAAGAPAAERGRLLLELASQYEDVGDLDAELRACARASREGVSLSPRAARLEELAGAPKTPDAEIAYLEATSELCLDQGDVARAADAFRDLGAALWIMADDRPRAVQAWLRGAHCDSAKGYETLRLDLTAFADTQYAVDCLSELVERESDRVRSGVIATQAARAALDVRAHARALGLAKIALDRDPEHADALETAELACVELARVPEMSALYDQAARRARGRFGRRAAHHRAARFFESGGLAMLALKHAAQAFIAVPSEGTTLGLLQRTAAKAQREAVAVRTLEHVAELARTTQARAGWLLRAASMTVEGLDGARQKTDILLKAAIVLPTPATIGLLAAAARDVVSRAPDDAAAVALRLERAGDQLAKGLEGPDGARIAITFVEMAMDPFADAEWGWRAFEQAIAADADVDEYAGLVAHAARFAASPQAREALARVMAEVDKPYANVGHALLLFAGAVAEALGDRETRAKVLVRAAEKEPDDDAIVVLADAAARENDDPALRERLSKRVGAPRLVEALRASAKEAIARGEAERAVEMLERAGAIAPPGAGPEIAKELGEALLAAGRGEEAVVRELSRDELAKPERAERWTELARMRGARGDGAGAADALLQAAAEDPTPSRWAAVERAADAAGRERLRVEALGHLLDLARAAGSGEVCVILKRLARAEGARGSLGAAEAAWREVMRLDPSDAEADVAIEALLVARESFEDLAEHLAQRASRLVKSASREDKDKLRAVRLRRAAILEQRLTRVEDARAELEQVLAEEPDHPGALRWIAELRVEVARAAKDPTELGDALAELARISAEEPHARSAMLVEAAQAAARSGNMELSLARAREAARLAPGVASTQLFARGLEYRLRGVGSTEDARATIRALERLGGHAGAAASLEPEDVALHAFLLAEAEDAAFGPGAGAPALERCLAQIGPQPLVALGLAERAARAGRHAEACRLYTEAVQGNLLGFRHAGRVAMAAAESASRIGDVASAARFLDEAAKDPDTRAEALRRVAQAALSSEPAAPLAEDEAPTRGQPAEIPDVPKIPPPPPVLLVTPAEEPATPGGRPRVGAGRAATGEDGAPAGEVPTTPAGKVAKARARLLHGSREEAERLLTEALREGSIEAADALDELLRDEPARRSELLKVRRRAVELRPGNVARLVALRDAARMDQHPSYVRAIEHVLRAFDAAAGPLPPPSLGAQGVQPGILTLLTCHSREAAGEALGIVWEGAPAMFVRSAAAEMAGLERVIPGPTTALSRLYEAALRLLDTPRFALFHRRSSLGGEPCDAEGGESAALSVTVALLSTPAAILSGAAREDTPELRWALGQALSCVLPENALALGLDAEGARSLWGVLLGAFGPPGLVSIDRAQAELADMLWQTLAPRTQRRLKDLLASEGETPFELVLERAKQSGRRLGMFLTGDFAHAARATMAELSKSAAELERPEGLERACAELPAVADLLRLAVRPEFADARWHAPPPASERLSSGKLRPV